MYKKSTSVVSIVTKSLGIFFEKFPSFLKYIAYPVLGQFAGVIICFLPFLTAKDPKAVSISLVFLCMIAGLIVFCHAFWRYLLVSGGLVLISKQIVENEPLQEFGFYTKAFQKRSKEYVSYLLIMILISLLFVVAAVIWVFAMIGRYYNVASIDMTALVGQLAFQGLIFGAVMFLVASILSVTLETFVLNPNLTPFKSILKAVKLAFKNYFPNLGLVILLALISVIWSEVFGLILGNAVFNEAFYAEHPREYADMLSFIQGVTQGCIVNLLLPLMTLCRTWWYLRMEKEYMLKVAKKD